MTGRSRPAPPTGVKTFRYRQSSDVLVTPKAEGGCGQCGAKLVAARTPVHGAAGCGGRQRSAPTGGAAYGMPRYSSVAPAVMPCTQPSAVSARGASPASATGACRVAVPLAVAISASTATGTTTAIRSFGIVVVLSSDD